MNQTTIFDMMYPRYKITKPIRLIELFAGYGSQALALKYLGVSFEHWKICEWAVKSIQAYKDIHHEYDETYPPILENQTKEEMVDYLYNKGISSNYNEPMTRQQIERLNEKQLRQILNNIYQTHNLVNIQQVKGKDLEIVDTDKYEYIMTYSFPCQDLSLAGKGKGMGDTSTRSGMLWEVERILTECTEIGTMPQILLMENVPQVHSLDNMADFHKWQVRLEELGYKSYWQDLIATDYGIPQTRNRCFMVSILGDYSYQFPKPIPLKLKLKDMLEDNVDEKYYLSDKMIDFFTHNAEKQKEKGNGFSFNATDGDIIAKTITTRAGSRMDDNFIIGKIKQWHQRGNVYSDEYSLSTICATDYKTPKLVGVKTIGNYSPSNHNASRVVAQEYSAPTVMENHGTITATQTNDLRIRKLTPRECGRLQGVKDSDIDKLSSNQSDSSAYHLFGDSICTNCLMAIFGELLDIEWEKYL